MGLGRWKRAQREERKRKEASLGGGEFVGVYSPDWSLIVELIRSLGGPVPPERVTVRYDEDESLHYFAFRDPVWGSPRTVGWTCPK